MTEDEQKALEELRAGVDVSKFSNKPYIRRIEKNWGHELHFVPDGLPYMGKMLYLNEGKRSSLQAHDRKQESWYWGGGDPVLLIENSDGDMQEIHLREGEGYTCMIGQKHRLMGGKGGGVFIEVSTPEDGNTFRIEDDYNRPTETEQDREKRNQDGKN
jgi:mannose-6-phosphate isomerase-like protein (cupin superfamily)